MSHIQFVHTLRDLADVFNRENIHAETYARFIQELIVDEDELRTLFGAIDTIPSVKRKADWCLKWFDRTAHSFATRVIAFAIVEGIFFSSSFAAIFWIRARGLMPGLCHSNELIMRDEGLHMDFACRLYNVLDEKVDQKIIHQMVSDAVGLEQAFFACKYHKPIIGQHALTATRISCSPQRTRGIERDLDEPIRSVRGGLLAVEVGSYYDIRSDQPGVYICTTMRNGNQLTLSDRIVSVHGGDSHTRSRKLLRPPCIGLPRSSYRGVRR